MYGRRIGPNGEGQGHRQSLHQLGLSFSQSARPGRSCWRRDESRHVPVNKQLSDESKAKGSKILHCSPPFPPMLSSPQTLGAFSYPHPPPLPTQPPPAYKCLVGAGVLCIMDFLPGNFLWWKLWGNFLLSRLLPRADKGNCLKPPAAAAERVALFFSVSSQSRGTREDKYAEAPG